jgi:hypothetical protein
MNRTAYFPDFPFFKPICFSNQTHPQVKIGNVIEGGKQIQQETPINGIHATKDKITLGNLQNGLTTPEIFFDFNLNFVNLCPGCPSG